jgi:HK97 family phage prohead protease
MKTKTFSSPIELKADGQPGEFRAIFSRFNVIDHDGDVTIPGAFKDGEAVRISYWGHRWLDLPVGKGIIHQDEEKAWIDGLFFMDTQVGKETYQTVKNLENLQEWSYGYDLIDSKLGQFDNQDVQFLNKITVYEVSPVMLGAGIGTETTDIKSKNDKSSLSGDGTEDEAGNGKSSGAVDVVRTQIDIVELED